MKTSLAVIALLFSIFSSAQTADCPSDKLSLQSTEAKVETFEIVRSFVHYLSYTQTETKFEALVIYLANYDLALGQFGADYVDAPENVCLKIEVTGPPSAWAAPLINITPGVYQYENPSNSNLTRCAIGIRVNNKSVPLFRNKLKVEGSIEIISITENNVCGKLNFKSLVNTDFISLDFDLPLIRDDRRK